MARNILTADVQFILLRNNKIHDVGIDKLPKITELSKSKQKKMNVFIKSVLENPDYVYMHLFYSGAPIFKGAMLQIINGLTCSIKNGYIILSCKVKFSLTKNVKATELRNNILDSFVHWSNRGDIEYGLKKFQVVSKVYKPYEKIIGKLPIYHNLL